MQRLNASQCAELITATIRQDVADAGTATRHRHPLVAFVRADDPRFADLRRVAHADHMLPRDLLTDARSVVSFFLPFAPAVVEANTRHREKAALEWALAYLETNALIGHILAHLIELLAAYDVRAAAEPATGNFDPDTLCCRWSHKSVAVIAGLGGFGLHHMVITDAGCAGRFGSLVVSADLPVVARPPRERCIYYRDGSCLECVYRCPVHALDGHGQLDKRRCWHRCLENATTFAHLGKADVCGKCATGPCALASAV